MQNLVIQNVNVQSFDLFDLYDLKGFTDEQYWFLHVQRDVFVNLIKLMFTQRTFSVVRAYVQAGFHCTQEVIDLSGKSKTGCINLLKTLGVYQTKDTYFWQGLVFMACSYLEEGFQVFRKED